MYALMKKIRSALDVVLTVIEKNAFKIWFFKAVILEIARFVVIV